MVRLFLILIDSLVMLDRDFSSVVPFIIQAARTLIGVQLTKFIRGKTIMWCLGVWKTFLWPVCVAKNIIENILLDSALKLSKY